MAAARRNRHDRLANRSYQFALHRRLRVEAGSHRQFEGLIVSLLLRTLDDRFRCEAGSSAAPAHFASRGLAQKSHKRAVRGTDLFRRCHGQLRFCRLARSPAPRRRAAAGEPSHAAMKGAFQPFLASDWRRSSSDAFAATTHEPSRLDRPRQWSTRRLRHRSGGPRDGVLG